MTPSRWRNDVQVRSDCGRRGALLKNTCLQAKAWSAGRSGTWPKDWGTGGRCLLALWARLNGPPGGGPYLLLVEVARIELASASPLLRGLHAYSVFDLTAGYPTGRENLQPVQSDLTAATLDPLRRRSCEVDPWDPDAQARAGQRALGLT